MNVANDVYIKTLRNGKVIQFSSKEKLFIIPVELFKVQLWYPEYGTHSYGTQGRL